jgi:hypothetical protein
MMDVESKWTYWIQQATRSPIGHLGTFYVTEAKALEILGTTCSRLTGEGYSLIDCAIIAYRGDGPPPRRRPTKAPEGSSLL